MSTAVLQPFNPVAEREFVLGLDMVLRRSATQLYHSLHKATLADITALIKEEQPDCLQTMKLKMLREDLEACAEAAASLFGSTLHADNQTLISDRVEIADKTSSILRILNSEIAVDLGKDLSDTLKGMASGLFSLATEYPTKLPPAVSWGADDFNQALTYMLSLEKEQSDQKANIVSGVEGCIKAWTTLITRKLLQEARAHGVTSTFEEMDRQAKLCELLSACEYNEPYKGNAAAQLEFLSSNAICAHLINSQSAMSDVVRKLRDWDAQQREMARPAAYEIPIGEQDDCDKSDLGDEEGVTDIPEVSSSDGQDSEYVNYSMSDQQNDVPESEHDDMEGVTNIPEGSVSDEGGSEYADDEPMSNASGSVYADDSEGFTSESE